MTDEITNQLKRALDNYANKNYGEQPDFDERKAEMLRLRFEEKWTLSEIGELFGVTKERVRQIIGNTGGKDRKRKIKPEILARNESILSSTELTNQELSDKFGISKTRIGVIRGKTRHAIEENCNSKYGADAENVVASKLTVLGFKTELMPHKHPFDILIENFVRVDVKSTYKQRRKNKTYLYYSFSVRKNSRQKCDFYVCYIHPLDKFFVIPALEIPPQRSMITVSYPPKKREGRYIQYLDRFDLLWEFIKTCKPNEFQD